VVTPICDAILRPAPKGNALMRLRLLSYFLLLITVLASGKQEKKEPDAVNISGNTMEAPYFKLHYTFPQGWSAENDDARKEKNRQSHERAVKLAEAMHAQTINSGATSTTYFSNYELFMGKREPVPADGNSSEPFILIRASERSGGLMNDAGDTAKFIGRTPPAKLVEGPKEQKLSGHRFMRSLLVFFPQEANEQFEVMYESVSGNYFLLFEFHAATQKEANELAQSMESVKFDK
jgi:hypothetical protein